MVAIPGEGEGIEPQRVHRGEPQQPKVGLHRLEVGEVERDEIVAQQSVHARGERIELCQCGHELTAVEFAAVEFE